MINRGFGIVGVLVLLGLAACAGPPAGPSSAANVAVAYSDPPDLAGLQAAVDRLVDAGAPAAVAEITSGEGRWTVAAGVSRIDGPPAGADAPVRIASVTKAMVAAVVLQLVGEGTLTLDGPVDAVLPGLLPRPVTVRQLLDHTSGLPNFLTTLLEPTAQGFVDGATRHYTDDQLIAAALAQPWPSEPGAAFAYSNTNYVVLGRIVERITGTPVADALRTRVFEPAGMTSTTYPTGPDLPEGALTGYLVEGAESIDVARYDPTIFGASGAVVSTVGDVNRFFRALLDGTLLGPDQVAALREVPASGYGLGVQAGGDACVPGTLVYGQTGNGIGYRTIAFASPDGQRQVTLAWTASTTNPAADPRQRAAQEALIAGLTVTCP